MTTWLWSILCSYCILCACYILKSFCSGFEVDNFEDAMLDACKQSTRARSTASIYGNDENQSTHKSTSIMHVLLSLKHKYYTYKERRRDGWLCSAVIWCDLCIQPCTLPSRTCACVCCSPHICARVDVQRQCSQSKCYRGTSEKNSCVSFYYIQVQNEPVISPVRARVQAHTHTCNARLAKCAPACIFD